MKACLIAALPLLASIALPVAGMAQAVKNVRQTPAELTATANWLVDDVMQRPRGFLMGKDMQFGRVLGDRLAMAITRKLRMKDLDNPDNADKALSLLEYAFSDPEKISDAGDARPAVTLFLTDYLAEHCPVASLRLRASDLVAKLIALNSAPAGRAGPLKP